MKKADVILIILTSAVLAVTLITLALFSPERKKQSLESENSGKAEKSGEEVLMPTFEQVVLDDVLAVACNVVRGKVVSMETVDSDSQTCKVMQIEVLKDYGVFELIYASQNTIAAAYETFEGDLLAPGDECILVLSNAAKNRKGTKSSEASLNFRYIIARPEYCIMRKTDEGYQAKNFMKISSSSGYKPDSDFYTLSEVEKVILANKDKIKGMELTCIVPVN